MHYKLTETVTAGTGPEQAPPRKKMPACEQGCERPVSLLAEELSPFDSCWEGKPVFFTRATSGVLTAHQGRPRTWEQSANDNLTPWVEAITQTNHVRKGVCEVRCAEIWAPGRR